MGRLNWGWPGASLRAGESKVLWGEAWWPWPCQSPVAGALWAAPGRWREVWPAAADWGWFFWPEQSNMIAKPRLGGS